MSQNSTHGLGEFADGIFSFDQVSAAITALAEEINTRLPSSEPLLVLCLLNGGLVLPASSYPI